MGNQQVREVPKIKKETMKIMKEQEQRDIEKMNSERSTRTVLKEFEEIDTNGNIKKVMKEVTEEVSIRKSPTSRNLTQKVITDNYGNEKTVLVDENNNIVNQEDVEYETE